MATEAIIDIESLLAPFPGDNPVGEDIREDYSPTSIYYQIKDARAQARTSERQILTSDDPDAIQSMVPEWRTVLELAPKILQENGKDLEITAWYIEALTRAYGFAGLRDGLKLTKGLVENFWDGLFPLPDEDGLETRIAPLTGLNGEDGPGTLIVPISQIPLTQGFSHSPFAAWHYEQAYEIETITDPDKKEARLASGAISMKFIEQAISETQPSFFLTLKEDVNETLNAFSELSAVLDEKCGHDGPPVSNIRNGLKRVVEIIGFMTKDIVFETEESSNDDTDSEEGTTATSNSVVSSKKSASIDSVSINTRDEAFRALLKVSEFFRKTEPHSPVSYNVEQAVKWGRMPLPELLGELIPDERAREEYFRLAGISKSSD